MKASQVYHILRGLAEQQWGLLTTAQARSQGIGGVDLQRARQAEAIVPIRHGVHRLSGVPEDRFEALRAEWLATRPEQMAHERFEEADPVVVSGPTAAWVHEVGDLLPEPYQFTSPIRHQSRSHMVSFRRRNLPVDQVTMVAGLPVTTLEATVVDLLSQGEDVSLVADVLTEAASHREFRREVFQHLVESACPSQAQQVLRLAGLDLDSETLSLTRSPAGQALVAEAARQSGIAHAMNAQQLAPFQHVAGQALKPIHADMEQWVRSYRENVLSKISLHVPVLPAVDLSLQTRQAIASVIRQSTPLTVPFGKPRITHRSSASCLVASHPFQTRRGG